MNLLECGLTQEELDNPVGGCADRFIQRDGLWYYVRRGRVIGARWFTYSVYLPKTSIMGTGLDGVEYSSSYSGNESLIYPGDGQAYSNWGEFSSRFVPSDVLAGPKGIERAKRISRYYGDLQELSYSLICEAFPEATSGSRCMGGIEVVWG